jgi:hypothetical protein
MSHKFHSNAMLFWTRGEKKKNLSNYFHPVFTLPSRLISILSDITQSLTNAITVTVYLAPLSSLGIPVVISIQGIPLSPQCN